MAEGDPTNPDDISDPNEKVVERFLKHITDPVKKDLALYASLPNQLNQDVIECLLPEKEKGKAKDYFNWIKGRPFVEKRGGHWAYHPIVKETLLRHQREVSEKEWIQKHEGLVEWYESKIAPLRTEEDNGKWFEDETLIVLIVEKHFHFLCINYKKHIPGVIRDFTSGTASFHYPNLVPLVTILNKVEEIFEVKNSWGPLLLKGLGALMSGEEEGLLDMFREINNSNWIKNDHEKSMMFYGQGVYEKNEEEKIQCYTKAIELNPKYADAYNNLGNLMYKAGDIEGAIAQYKKAIELNPKHADVYYNLGNLMYKAGDIEGAITQYKKAIEINPKDALAYNNLGVSLKDSGDIEGAIAQYKKAIELNPKYALTYNNLGVSLKDSGDTEGAIAQYKKAIELNPNNPNAYFNLGILLSYTGDIEGGAHSEPSDPTSPNL